MQRRLAQKSEIFGELPRSRRRATPNRNRDKMNAVRFRILALTFAKLRRFTTKIDDGGDAELLKFVKTFNVRLRAAKKRIGNLTGVGNAKNWKFFRDGRNEDAGGEESETADCRNRTESESEEKNKTKSKAKERIANWLETV